MEQKNPEIPVVFTPDENYMVPTCVAILSMLETKKEETRYKFFIVVSDKINRECLQFVERIKKLREDFAYRVIFINADEFDGQKITTGHLTTSAYYRLSLADILPEYEKCMYHDGDILVCKDLQEMFDVNLDNCYLAGVKAILKHQDTSTNRTAMQRWGFTSFDNYINSGDLIFNLAKIRKDLLTVKFREEMNKGYPSEDQDVLNYCCYGKISFLPLKFAMLSRWLNVNALTEMENQVYTPEEIAEARETPAIIHFLGRSEKPWNNLRVVCQDKWWEYAKRILSDEEYSVWYQKAEEATKQRDWRFLKQQLEQQDQPVIIFGYSQIGRKVFDTVSRWGFHIPCMIDNDRSKQGEFYEGCEVLDVATALQKFPEAFIINTSQRFFRVIREQLLTFGVPAERILDYTNKSARYYLALDPQYYEEELRDLFVRDCG